MKKKPIITICSSCDFYRKVNDIKEILEPLGFEVLIPDVAAEMKRTGDYEVSHYKTWFADPNDYPKKAKLIHGHFDEVAKADAILVINEEKKGRPNYIGGNVLMEMALAFNDNKPIFILNEIPDASDVTYQEEILGMLPILLHGDINKLPDEYAKLA